MFKQFEERAGQEHKLLSPTPGQYGSFLKQISQMWATQPHITDAQLKAIHTPVVIADGRYDEGIKQSHDRYMASTIPDAHLVILPGVSHFAMLQTRICSPAPCWTHSQRLEITEVRLPCGHASERGAALRWHPY